MDMEEDRKEAILEYVGSITARTKARNSSLVVCDMCKHAEGIYCTHPAGEVRSPLTGTRYYLTCQERRGWNPNTSRCERGETAICGPSGDLFEARGVI